ncbi:hypothetical protein F7725_023862 [Dissostichus mawsoni]|uniref:Uncharacterized protein n=1 Tax=Dissostichus mawsoni TaxID=36200 RepID=A0A7J5XYG3_DISMA|nr:hypothetical protein F7725_023862 [Dissostichus mawsoni]
MGGEEFCQRYQNQLEGELDETFSNFTKHNDGKNIFYTARTPATLFAVMFVTYVVSGTLAALANLAMGVALLSLCAWAYVKYSGEFREVGTLIDLVAETLWEQVGHQWQRSVLKPLSEHYMEDNVRQTVVNSIKASLTESGSQHTKLKTH